MAAPVNTVTDDWGTPRWEQADQATGGPPGRTTLLDRLASGTVLDAIEPGSVLDPTGPRKRRQPVSRCSRCGCWSTPTNVILRQGVLWCRTCCGGHAPTDGQPGP
jgi:hypothetical protein